LEVIPFIQLNNPKQILANRKTAKTWGNKILPIFWNLHQPIHTKQKTSTIAKSHLMIIRT